MQIARREISGKFPKAAVEPQDRMYLRAERYG
jgi:hypothetical protein